LIKIFLSSECRKYIEEAEVAIKNSDQAKANKATILGQYLDRKDMFNLSTNDVVSVMSEFLIGGVDTVRKILKITDTETRRH